MLSKGIALLLFLTPLGLLGQGSFAPAADQAGTTAIPAESDEISSWAWHCELYRGYQDIADKSKGRTTFGEASYATGISDLDVVSLGDSGVAVLTFGGWIQNKPGYDFAVFENSFRWDFIELAFVEVSSDGTHFVRFDGVSLSPSQQQRAFADTLHPTNIHNLAGKYVAGYGTPFDLEELKGTPNLNVDSITHVRIVDVIGVVSGSFAQKDSRGNVINDPYPTPFDVGGFDLESVAVMHYQRDESKVKPTNISFEKVTTKRLAFFPNPATTHITLVGVDKVQWQLLDVHGREVMHGAALTIELSDVPNGVYFLHWQSADGAGVEKVIKR